MEVQNIAIVALVTVVVVLAALLVSVNTAKQSVQCTVPKDLKVTYDKPVLADERLDKTYWACNGLVCNRYYAPQEWVNKYCAMKDGQAVCSVQTSQGNMVYPLNSLNVTAIKQCAEYTCMQEVLVRNASYVIPAP
ncbi:MAG: hypothetical protein V1744_06820 [Candidatus Altiarchaeota archaeon]